MNLTGVSDPDLEQLLRAIRRGSVACPVTTTGLVSAGLGHVADRLGGIGGLGRDAALLLLEAVLAERQRGASTRVSLVWTGPDAGLTARDTAVVVRELFWGARRSVIVAGFAFYDASDIFEPLHAVMRGHGVEASFFLHVGPAGDHDPAALVQRVDHAVARFFEQHWPFGDPRPAVYYDPRTVVPSSGASLHAKCIVVDEKRTLITSANFTDRAHTRNIEVGALVDDEHFARDLVAQWRSAVEVGLLRQHG